MKELYELYYERLVYFGLKLIADKQVVEDIVIDSFVALFEKGYEQTGGVLFIMVKNKCANHARNEKRRHLINDKLFDEEYFEAEIIESGVVKLLMAAVDKLPPDERRVIEMFYFDDKSCVEIACELNKKSDTIRSLKRHGLTKLFKLIKHDPST